MSNKITCTCGHSWNKSSSSKKDMKICHICGKDNTMKNGGWLDAYDEEMQLGGFVYPTNYVPQAENGIEGSTDGLTDQGFNYNGAWGGTMQMGGAMPGSVGFSYARTKGIPSEGPYAKKTLASAQVGRAVSDNTRVKPIITDKPMNRESVGSTESFTPRDNRSIFSDARAKERGDALWDGTKKATAIGQFSPEPVSRYSSIGLNSLMGAADAYFSLKDGDTTNARINAIGAVPLPSFSTIKAIRNIPGLTNRQRASALSSALAATGIDLFGVGADLTNNFGLENKPEKKQNGGEMSFYQNGLDWTPRNISKNGSQIPQAEDGEEVTLEDLLKVTNKKAVYDNIPHPSVLKAKAETDIKAKQQAAVNAQRHKQGEIKNIPKQSIIDKTKSAIDKGLSIAAHPMTAAAYLAKGQRIPDNFEKGNLNSYDFATSILNPASVAYSAGQIPGNIEDGDYTQALFNTMGALPALGMVPAAMKKVNPLLYDINKQLIANKDYGKMAAINLMSAADAAGPMIMKTPGLKSLYKKAAYNAASTSGGNTWMSPGEAFRNILFPRLGEKNKYVGSVGKKTLDRDLVRQYIYGDAPGFENIDIKPYGLEKYVDKYGDMEVFKMNSEIAHGQPLTIGKNENFAKKFKEAMTDSGGNEAATERGYVTVPLTSKANPVLPIDDVAGHTVRVSNTGVPENYKLTSQDIWKFDPDEYLKRWGMGSSRSGGMRPDDYQMYLQAKLLERAGKPFVLMQENPLQWVNSKISSPPPFSSDKNILQDLIDNPNLTKEDLYDNLINFELFTKPPVQDNKLSKSIKFKREDGGIVKDDNGYWNPENWGKPVEIGSNNITMQGVDQDLIGVSNKGDVKLMKANNPKNYKFKGKKVTEYPIAQDGETLLKNKKVGQLETPTGKLNLRPTYPNFKTRTENVVIPGCPEGAGCSKQATVDAQKITGLPYVSYGPANAAYRDAVAERTGLINIFDQEGFQKENADSQIGEWKYPTNDDFKNWRAGDIVTLDAGTDYYFPYNAPPGFSIGDNHGNSHVGSVHGFTPEGRPIIKHGVAKGRDAGKSWTEVLGEDNRVTDLGHGRYAVKSVWRPKEVDADGTIKDIENVVDLGKDAAKRKQDTTSNEQFYLKNTDEERMMQENPVAGEFSGASNRLDTKKKLVNLFNDKKLNKDLQYKFGITAEELNNLKPVVYGIFGQESNFNDVDSPAASFKEILGNMLGGNSRGAAQIKLKSLTPEERKILGVKKSSDLDSDEAAYKAALLMVSNAKKRMDKEVAQGTHPELANVDENFRAGYYYNSPGRAVNSAKDWAKKSKPSQWFNPLSWKNAITTRERPDVFGGINPNYVNNAELRMDEGSYPYKLMENARDLGVGVDFEKGKDLEEVVVRGTTKPNTTFVKKKNGGWLDEL